MASANNAIISTNQTLNAGTNATISQGINNTLDDSTGGLVFEVKTSAQSLTMKDNLTIGAIAGDTTHNAYGILIDSATTEALSIASTDWKSISITALPTTQKTDGKAYVYANNSSQVVTFDKVNLVVAATSPVDLGKVGIYAGIANAKFDFGAVTGKTTFAGAENGIVIAESASFENNLAFTAMTGATGATGATGVDGDTTGKVGGKGADAYGITSVADGKTLNLNGSITFAGITGGTGGNGGNGFGTGDTNGGNGGVGGDAFGIYLSGTNGLTIAGSGVITFTAVTGGTGGTGGTENDSGTGGSQGANGNAYIINNASTGKTLTLDGISIVAGTALSGVNNLGTFGIQNTMATAAVYNFGSGTASTTFAAFAPQAAANNSNGKDSVGFITSGDVTLSGNLTFAGVVAQEGGDKDGTSVGKGGSAYGIASGVNGTTNKTITLKDANITFAAITAGNGGNDSGGTGGTGGDVYGIYLDKIKNQALTISGNGSLVFTALNAGKGGNPSPARAGATTGDAGKAYVINNAGTGKLAFTGGASLIAGVATNAPAIGTFGIYNQLTDANYVFGAGSGSSAGTEFTIQSAQGAAGNASSDGQSGADAQGIVMARSLSHTGYLKQTITGAAGGAGTADGKNGGAGADGYGLVFEGDSTYTIASASATKLELIVNGGAGGAGGAGKAAAGGDAAVANGNGGTGGNAYGIAALSGNATLAIGQNATAIVSATAGAGGAVGTGGTGGTAGVSGEAVGILVKTVATENRDDAKSKLTISGTGALALTVGDATNTIKAYGLKLENGVFAGSLNFADNGIQTANDANNVAYGIHTNGASVIESGIITFAAANSLNAGTDGKTYVLFNEGTGTLTIGGGAKIANAAAATNLTGITDTFGGVYSFGSGAAATTGATPTPATVGTQINGVNAATAADAAITGLSFAPTADDKTITLGGKLGVRAGNATAAEAGGAATGLAIDASTITAASKGANLVISDSGLTLNVIGGDAKQGTRTAVNGGVATGLSFTTATGNKNITVSGGDISLVLKEGKDSANGTTSDGKKAFVHLGDGQVIFDGVTLYNVFSVGEEWNSLGNSYGIYNVVGADYDFGSATDATTFQAFTAGKGRDATTEVSFAGSGNQAVGIVSSTTTGVMRHAGNLTFEGITGGTGGNNTSGNGGKGGEAIGIVMRGGQYAFEDGAHLSMTITGGQGGSGSTASGTKGDGGEAYGLVVRSYNSGFLLKNNNEVTLTVKGGAQGADGKNDGKSGDAVGILVGIADDMGSTDEAARKLHLSIETNSALKLQVGDKTTQSKNKDAYGIKLYGSEYEGFGTAINFDGTNSWVAANDTDGKAYALYSTGDSTFTGGNIVVGATGLLGAQTYALYNEGNLTLGERAQIAAGTTTGAANTNLYAAANSTLNVAFAAGSSTTFAAQKAFDFATTGGVDVSLENDSVKGGAKLIFNGDGGNLRTLKGNNAEILLAGANQDALSGKDGRFTKTFVARSLNITQMGLDQSKIVLAANIDDNGAKKADKIVVSGIDTTTITGAKTSVDNTLYVSVNKYASEAKDERDVAILAEVSDNIADKVTFNGLTADGDSTTVTTAIGFTNGDIEIVRGSNGGTTYYVSNLVSTNVSINTDFVAPTTAALSAGVSVFSANLNSLSKRMGELRNDPYANGVWARVFAGEQTTDFGAKQSTVYSTFQAGYDYKLALEDASNYIGLALSYTKGAGGQVDPVYQNAPDPLKISVAGLTSSNTDGVEVALYNSYVASSGLYSDTIVKAGYYMTDLTMFAQTDTYSTSNLAVAVSEEIGYKVKLGESNEWFITPQGEVAFAYMGGTEFTQNLGGDTMKSTQDATSLLRARVGAAWGYDFSHLAKESDVKASLYVGTYYAYDYFMGGDTTLSTTVGSKTVGYTHNAYEGTGRFVMNLGTNIDIKDSTKVYVDFEKSFGGSIQTDYQISLGVRFGFGEKVSAPKPEEKKSSEPILKPKELDENAAE